MTVTFLLLAHDDPAGLARLVARLRAPTHRFVVHVDRRVVQEPFAAELAGARDVILLDDAQRLACHWAGWSICAAMIRLLATARAQAPADWYQFLSGSDYPLCATKTIESYYRRGEPRLAVWREITADARTPLRLRNRVFGWNFNDVAWMNRREQERLPALLRCPLAAASQCAKALLLLAPRRHAPAGWRVFRGSQWAALSAAEAARVDAALADGTLARFLARTGAPDELLLPSLLADGAATVRVPQAGVRHATHWIDWRDQAAPRGVTPEDIEAAMASGALFCRKLPPSDSATGRDLRDRLDARMSGVAA